MLSRVSSSVRRSVLRPSSSRLVAAAASRNYVQPSGADRASVVDVPSSYQDDAFFAPRQGEQPNAFSDPQNLNIIVR